MGSAGLLLVGVVLFINGLVILSVVPQRSAALLNIFVGGIQLVLPILILVLNHDNPVVTNATWPTFLFGITYLYYGLGIYLDLEPEGLGWFSIFVTGVVGYLSVKTIGADPVLAVMLGTWAFMWFLFFALMALGREELSRFTGWFLVLLGIPTCTVPGIAQLEGHWTTSPSAGLLALAVVAAGTVLSVLLARSNLASGTIGSAASAQAV